MRKRRDAGTSNEGIRLSAEGDDDEGIHERRASSSSSFSYSSRKIFFLCLVARIVNALLVQTYFNPDEHWQALEVAHRVVFGYGHLTWEWKKGIRSYLHPLLFALLYKVLALFHLDTPRIMMKAPRVFQALFAAVGDLYLYNLSDVLFGHHVAQWTLFSQLTNWFLLFCFTRTLSNSLETVISIVSLYYWPCIRVDSCHVPSRSRKLAVAFAALSCAIRPTSAITWIYVGILELFSTRDRFRFLLLEVAPIGTLVLVATLLVDRMLYGSWVLVPLNFLKFNFFSSGGDYYGTHKWHWYFTQGFTVMLFSFLPFSVAGIIYSKRWKIAGLVAWVLVTYSSLGHKEFRFVLPVLPIALMFSGYSLAAINSADSSIRKKKRDLHGRSTWRLHLAMLLLLVTNIPMALYMSMVHQRGTEDVMGFLSRKASHGEVKQVLFLMPCHSTPYYSALHRDLPMRFLDCTPSEEGRGPDESDRFMMDPPGFASEFAKIWSLPSHIILFDSEEKKLKDFLMSHSFVEVGRFFHSHFKVDRDLQAAVVVYALRDW